MASKSEIGFLFDLDGVLLDSERRYTEIWKEIDRLYPTGVKDFPHVIKGKTLTDILIEYFPDESVAKEVKEYCLEAEDKMTFDYMPGAINLLYELKSKNIKRALVTSSDAVKMKRLVKQIPDILDWFDAVIYGDMVVHGKPDPEPYLLGAKLLNLQPENCIIVEDALTGIASGRAAGSYVIGVSDTLGRETIMGKADIVVDTLDEIDVDSLLNLHGEN